MKIEIYQQKIQTVCLLVLTAITIAAALKLFSAVIIPFVLAVFLTFCFAPVIEAQMKLLHVPRSIALVTTIILVCIVLGVDFAWMFGFGAFLLNFIPNIGSLIATLFPLPAILLSAELSIAAKVLAIAIPSAIQFTIGNLLQPKLMGQSLDLHPVSILLALIFFGAIWGIIGMLLATPITAVLKILLEKFEYTHSVANLLAGRTDTPEEGDGELLRNLDKTGEPPK